MTILPDKTASTALGPDKQIGLIVLNLLQGFLLAVTMLSLPSGGGPIHCVGGIFLLIGCGFHLALHGRWIKAVILETPKNIPPGLRRQRRLFCGMVLSGLLCGLSGMVTLPSLFCATPIHAVSGLVFLGLNTYHLILHRNWFRKKMAVLSTPSRG